MTTLTSSRPTKQSQKTRTVRLADTDGGPALVIRQQQGTQAPQTDVYYLTEIGADQGRGFELRKHDGRTVYHVNAGGPHESCDCKGHLQHGHKTVCKHRASIARLIALGVL